MRVHTIEVLRRASEMEGPVSPSQMAIAMSMDQVSVRRALWTGWEMGYFTVSPGKAIGIMMYHITPAGLERLGEKREIKPKMTNNNVNRKPSTKRSHGVITAWIGGNPFWAPL